MGIGEQFELETTGNIISNGTATTEGSSKPVTLESINEAKRLIDKPTFPKIKFIVNRFLPKGTIMASPDVHELINQETTP
jgi:hypothetical protein